MAHLNFPFALHSERQDGEPVVVDKIESREQLLNELEGLADVSRDEADLLARKILAGQRINVSAHGESLGLYGSEP